MGRFIDITGAPIVSDFQEMPLDFMAKALSAKQASYDKQELDSEALKLLPEGFIATKGYKDELLKEINPKLSEWSKRAIADPDGVGRDIAKYKTQLVNDPRYRLLAADTAKKADYLKAKAEAAKLGVPFEKAFDYKARQYKGPIDSKKLVAGEVAGDLEDFYGNPFYGDVNKELLERLKDVKTITIGEANDWLGGITGYGDQIKNSKSIDISSNSIYDTTPALQGANGKWYSIGDLTKMKLDQIGSTWLLGNTPGAQYVKTDLSPIQGVQGDTPEAKLKGYIENLYNPISTSSKKTNSGFTSFGTNAFDAEGKKKEQERIAVPGQQNYSKDADGFKTLATDTHNTKMDYAKKVASRMVAAGKFGNDSMSQAKAIVYYSNPANLNKLMDEYTSKLSGYETKIRNGESINKDDYTYTKNLKDDLNGLVDAMQAESKLIDRTVNALSPLKKLAEERAKFYGKGFDSIEQAKLNDINYIIDNVSKGANIADIMSNKKYDYLFNDLKDVIENSVKPVYSATTGTGADTGTINVVQKAITNSWGQNMSLFEGQSKDLLPQKWLREQLGADDKTNIQLVGASLDGDGKWVATYKADNGATKSFVYKDQGELESLKKTTIQDLRRSGDQNAIQFANMLSFKDELKANNQQGNWLALGQARPTLQKPVTVTIKLPDMQGNLVPLPIKKAINTIDGTTYYELGNTRATSLDELEMKLGQLIQ
jgi:hypothetical protein